MSYLDKLKAEICCLRKESKNIFISDAITVNYANPIDAVLESTAGINVGIGVSGTYANIAALIVALNGAYTGVATFLLEGTNKIKITTVDKFGVLTLSVSN